MYVPIKLEYIKYFTNQMISSFFGFSSGSFFSNCIPKNKYITESNIPRPNIIFSETNIKNNKFLVNIPIIWKGDTRNKANKNKKIKLVFLASNIFPYWSNLVKSLAIVFIPLKKYLTIPKVLNKLLIKLFL